MISPTSTASPSSTRDSTSPDAAAKEASSYPVSPSENTSTAWFAGSTIQYSRTPACS